MSRHRKRRGVILVVVISMLSILSILAVTFTMMARMERNISHNYTDLSRARMLAQAGIERAIMGLRGSTGSKGWEGAGEAWACGDAPNVPITALVQPSFPCSAPAYGRHYSTTHGTTSAGSMPGTYEQFGDTFVLRITDEASRLFVNGNEPHLGRMLDNLGQAIAQVTMQANPCPPGTGAAILTYRATQPGGIFADKATIAAVIGNTSYKILAPYITEHAWVDKSVLQPRAQTPMGWQAGPYFENLNWYQAIAAPPNGTGFGRAPVNVNTASVPVLACCMADLQGMELLCNASGWVPQFARQGSPVIGLAQAINVAQRIAAYRVSNPFTSMSQFEAYIDTILPPGGVGNPNWTAELIKANADPNTDFNDFNPNREITNWIGKENLNTFTTEFCLASMGFFEVESLGRVTANNGVEMATRHIATHLKVYDVLRHTTQADFVTALASGTGTGVVRTFPEHLDIPNTAPSVLDGQVCIKEMNSSGAGAAWYANYDSTILGSDNFIRTGEFGYSDCVNGGSVFNRFNTQPRDQPSANDVLCDGLYYSQARSKLAHYSSYHNLNPGDGTMGFWMKPNRLCYAGAMQGVALALAPIQGQEGCCWVVGQQPGFGFIVNGGHYGGF